MQMTQGKFSGTEVLPEKYILLFMWSEVENERN